MKLFEIVKVNRVPWYANVPLVHSRDQTNGIIWHSDSEIIEDKNCYHNKVETQRDTGDQFTKKVQISSIFGQLMSRLDKYKSNNINGRIFFSRAVLTQENWRKDKLQWEERCVAIYALTGIEQKLLGIVETFKYFRNILLEQIIKVENIVHKSELE